MPSLALDGLGIADLTPWNPRSYEPSYDHNGVRSRVLVWWHPFRHTDPAGIHTDPVGIMEWVTSFGAGVDYALEGESCDDLTRVWVDHVIHESGGLHVFDVGWSGSGEDADFDVYGVRRLTRDEEDFLIENRADGPEAMQRFWAKDWADVPCRHCKMLQSEHQDDGLCQPVAPATIPGP